MTQGKGVEPWERLGGERGGSMGDRGRGVYLRAPCLRAVGTSASIQQGLHLAGLMVTPRAIVRAVNLPAFTLGPVRLC